MEKYEEILALLGGFNCGGCGYADCEECAKAIANAKEIVKYINIFCVIGIKRLQCAFLCDSM